MTGNRRFLISSAPFIIFLLMCPASATASSGDAAFRDGWRLVSEEKYPEARASLGSIDPAEYDLGDYVVYLTGLSFARERLRGEASAALDNLSGSYPSSPLVPYLSHALAYAAAVDNDLPAARAYFASSRGKVNGNGYKAEEGYVDARLVEGDAPAARAAEAHLDNFAAYPAQEAASLSMERLARWRAEGKWDEWGLDVAFHGKYAKGLSRAAESEAAKAVYEDALRKFPPSDEYYAVLLDFAEFLRKIGETAESRALLDRAMPDAPQQFRNEVRFLKARVDWKAGRLAEAREAFLAISKEGSVRPGTAERARYNVAWISDAMGDLDAATEAFGTLRTARDEITRQESIFRYAFGRYRQKRFDEAAGLFASGEKTGFSSVEKARHAYWRGRALREAGMKEESEKAISPLAGDPGSGPYALFAARATGRDPYAMFNAPSSGETVACGKEREVLWDKVRNADWRKEDAVRIRRADRLVRLGIPEYAILEAGGIDRQAARKAIGLVEGGAPGLIRYLSGDLRGAIRETSGVPNDSGTVELIDRIQFPLAPDLLGDCERRRSGLDPLVLHSIVRQESLFQTNALSPAGAVGLMQLMPRTAAEVAKKEKMRKPRRSDLLKPQVNVTLGAAYLSRLVRQYGGDYMRAVAAYNAGEAAVAKWWAEGKGDPALFLESITFRETRFYLRRVIFNVLQYYSIYRPQMFVRYFPIAPAASPPDSGDSSPRPTEGTPGVPEAQQPVPEDDRPDEPPPPPPS